MYVEQIVGYSCIVIQLGGHVWSESTVHNDRVVDCRVLNTGRPDETGDYICKSVLRHNPGRKALQLQKDMLKI